MSLIKEKRIGDYLEFACECGYAIYNDPSPLNWNFCPKCGGKWERPVEPDMERLTKEEAERYYREPVPVSASVVRDYDPDPNMDRMGAQHIKECKGCPAMILWATHVKADGTIGKPAPLVKAKEGEKPNIAAWFDEGQDKWFYSIGAAAGTRPLEYLNHFANCERSKDFKPHQWKDANQRD